MTFLRLLLPTTAIFLYSLSNMRAQDPPLVPSALERTVSPSESDLSPEQAQNRAESLFREIGKSLGRPRDIRLVYSLPGLRREWRLSYPGAIVAIGSATGEPLSLIILDEMKPHGGSTGKATRRKLPRQQAIEAAVAFAKLFAIEFDVAHLQVEYRDVADLVPGDAFGGTWLISQPRREGFVKCLDSFVSVGIRATDGSVASLQKGYNPPKVGKLIGEMDEATAIHHFDRSALGERIRLTGNGELVVISPFFHGISAEDKPFLCWHFTGLELEQRSPVNVFIKVPNGPVYRGR